MKLLHLPLIVSDSFIEDLFGSRFTPFVKFKIFVDPSTNVLESRIVKKVAFVEVSNFSDFQKVTKWQDLYYTQTRKVLIEMADYHDFKSTMQFNEEHQKQLAIIEEENRGKSQNRLHDNGGGYNGARRTSHGEERFGPKLGPRIPSKPEDAFGPRLGSRAQNNVASTTNQPPLSSKQPILQPKLPLKPKSNPFGNAKPVDTLAKQAEIEKRLIHLNKTTVQTVGDNADKIDVEATIKKFHEASGRERKSSFGERRSSFSILKRPVNLASNLSNGNQSNFNKSNVLVDAKQTTSSNQSKINNASKANSSTVQDRGQSSKNFSPAPVPDNAYLVNSNGKSLAELLSVKPEVNNNKNSKKDVKKPVPKPIVLKKKVISQPVATTIKTSNESAVEDVKKVDEKILKSEPAHAEKVKEENKTNSEVDRSSEKISSVNDSKHTVDSSLVEKKKEINQTIERSNSKNSTLSSLGRSGSDRPDFKKRLDELVSNREKHVSQDSPGKSENPEYSNGENYRGRFSTRGRFATRGHHQKSYDGGVTRGAYFNNETTHSKNDRNRTEHEVEKSHNYKSSTPEYNQTESLNLARLSSSIQESTSKPFKKQSKHFPKRVDSILPTNDESHVPKKFQNISIEKNSDLKLEPKAETESSSIPKKFQNVDVEEQFVGKAHQKPKFKQARNEKFSKVPASKPKPVSSEDTTSTAAASTITPEAPARAKKVKIPKVQANTSNPESNNNTTTNAADEISVKKKAKKPKAPKAPKAPLEAKPEAADQSNDIVSTEPNKSKKPQNSKKSKPAKSEIATEELKQRTNTKTETPATEQRVEKKVEKLESKATLLDNDVSQEILNTDSSETSTLIRGGRGRGNYRGNYRGRFATRGRGRGNFNLSYVRPKDE